MSKENNLHDFLTDIADAVRSKTGKTEPINAQNLSSEIRSIESGEVYAFGETMVDDTGMGIKSINHIIVSEDVSEISAGAYKNIDFKSIQLPSSLKVLKVSCLEGTKITELFIPDTVHTLDGFAVKGCLYLKKVNIPKSLTLIGYQCFMSNPSLISGLDIPKTVTYIPVQCFYGCTALPSITFFEHTSVPTLENINAFDNTTCKFIVPDALYDEWIVATNWSTYADRIVKASEYQHNNE